MTKGYDIRVLFDSEKNNQEDYNLLTSTLNSEEVPFKTYPCDDPSGNGPIVYIKKEEGGKYTCYSYKDLKLNRLCLENFIKEINEINLKYKNDSLPFSD